MSDVAKKFNGLNGKVVSREEIITLYNEAFAQGNFEVTERLEKVIETDSAKFDISVTSKVCELSDTEINSLGVISDSDVIPLGRVVSPNDIYKEITNRLIKRMAKVAAGSYKKTCEGSIQDAYMIAFNYETKRVFSSTNQLMLTLGGQLLSNPYFLSLKQIEKHGGKLKPNAKPFEVMHVSFLYVIQKNQTIRGEFKRERVFSSYNRDEADAEFERLNNISKSKKITYKLGRITQPKLYVVYNGASVEGIDFNLKDFKIGLVKGKEGNNNPNRRIKIADLIVDNYKSPKIVKLNHGGDRAFYSPGKDFIQMPDFKSFDDSKAYYATLFHELAHSTGHTKRLDRLEPAEFGSVPYAKEELVAEITAVFVSAYAGIDWYSSYNHESYLKSWKSKLEHMGNDAQLIIRAAAKAQHAAEWILNIDSDGVPAFINILGKEKFFVAVDKGKKSEVARPSTKKPAAKKPAAKKPAVKKPVAKKPIAKKPVAKKPAAKKPIAKKPVAKKPVAKKPIAKKPIAKKPVAKKPAAKKPVAKKPVAKKPEENNTKQLALFGAKKKEVGLGLVTNLAETAEITPAVLPVRTNRLSDIFKAKNLTDFELYKIDDPEVKGFLGDLEIKENHSVVVTITGEQGSGKTRFLFQLMEAFAKNYRVGHASNEEHPNSKLYYDKAAEYLSENSIDQIQAEEVESITALDTMIKNNDVIFIDSFAKIKEIDKCFEIDKDLRKKYDGKLFFVIFQQTEQGKMRGGSKSQFDGDVILFTEKFSDYKKSYIYPNKHRYNSRSVDELKFSIYEKKLITLEEEIPDNQPVVEAVAQKYILTPI